MARPSKYSLYLKEVVLQACEQKESLDVIAKRWNIPRSTIRNWRRKADTLRTAKYNSRKGADYAA